MLAVARNAPTGVGAPSYTSGVHIWKGTMDSLKPKPAVASTAPAITASPPNGTAAVSAASTCAMVGAPLSPATTCIVPDAPYRKANPYNRNADDTAESSRYFTPASMGATRIRTNAASATTGSVASSSET